MVDEMMENGQFRLRFSRAVVLLQYSNALAASLGKISWKQVFEDKQARTRGSGAGRSWDLIDFDVSAWSSSLKRDAPISEAGGILGLEA